VAFSKHETALVETEWVGDGTHIGAFVHVLPGARIGRDCDIRDHAFIGSQVVVGDGVTIQGGVQLGDGLNQAEQLTRVGNGAAIASNATIVAGVQIAEQVVVSAGAVVTHDVPRNAIVAGNPARIVGYAGTHSAALPGTAPVAAGPEGTTVEGVILQRLPRVADLRGMLSFGETGREVPFEVKRYFVVFDVDSEHVRGEHAHRTLHQFLVCVHGRCSVVADDGRHRQEFVLDSPYIGLYIPPMTWAVQYKYSADGVLLALASDAYNPADYIRDYAEFLALKKGSA
jgi:carbonic anhydrase/acetyltransferase-like protein (isoleucine patch superfamily)/dTDP-4-dehydrorhamnose 3,5-epimerase-like enzyme